MRYRRTIGLILGGLVGMAAAWLDGGTTVPAEAEAYTLTAAFIPR